MLRYNSFITLLRKGKTNNFEINTQQNEINTQQNEINTLRSGKSTI